MNEQNPGSTEQGAPTLQQMPNQQTYNTTVTIPWYKSGPFWASAFLIVAILLLLAHMTYQKYLHEQELLAQQQAELEALKNKNDAAENYLKQLNSLLALDPCALAQALQAIMPPDGYTLPDLTAPITPRTQPAPSTPQVQPAAPQQGKPHASKAPAGPLTDRLEQATVCIISTGKDEQSMGSGFFITKDLIMTNAHVVKGGQKIIFTNKKMGVVQQARIAMFTEENGLDFAVLQTESPCAVTPLSFQEKQVSRTEKVSTWGYPDAVISDDPKFKALLKGDLTAAPEVVYSEGAVNVILEKNPPRIVHSAVVSHGNSGGPLTNEKGEVVGINTAISLDDQTYRQSSFAIPAETICKFLNDNGIPYTSVKRRG